MLLISRREMFKYRTKWKYDVRKQYSELVDPSVVQARLIEHSILRDRDTNMMRYDCMRGSDESERGLET